MIIQIKNVKNLLKNLLKKERKMIMRMILVPQLKHVVRLFQKMVDFILKIKYYRLLRN